MGCIQCTSDYMKDNDFGECWHVARILTIAIVLQKKTLVEEEMKLLFNCEVRETANVSRTFGLLSYTVCYFTLTLQSRSNLFCETRP